jgi:hypothetical protein
MRRGFAIALVYLGLILVPVLIVARSCRRSSPRQQPRQRCPLRARPARLRQKNRPAAQARARLRHHGKLEEQASKLPARLGDAAGVLSDIGLRARELDLRRGHDPGSERVS